MTKNEEAFREAYGLSRECQLTVDDLMPALYAAWLGFDKGHSAATARAVEVLVSRALHAEQQEELYRDGDAIQMADDCKWQAFALREAIKKLRGVDDHE